MDIKELAECLRLTADALDKCGDGIPSGFRLERIVDDKWEQSMANKSTMFNRYDLYRLVPIPQPRRIPHTRETWPGVRFILHTTVKGACQRATGTITSNGVYAQTCSGAWVLETWDGLTEYIGGDDANNLTTPLSQVVNE